MVVSHGRSTGSLDRIPMPAVDSTATRRLRNTRLAIFAIGAYLLVGAGVTAYTGQWFIGFPPQLDIAYAVVGGSRTGAYIEAALAAALGILLVYLATRSERNDAA
jgi:hypothetical protein